jgi:hypothetical protein
MASDRAFTLERMMGIELALSAWEADNVHKPRGIYERPRYRSESVNSDQASVVNVRVRPSRSVVSRTRITASLLAVSTQSAPFAEL